MRRLANWRSAARRDERGVEAPAMIIVIPVLFVLLLGLIDAGVYIKTRMMVENVARDTARTVAQDGGNYNARVNTDHRERDDLALALLVKNGKCKVSRCDKLPTIDCTTIIRKNGSTYRDNVVHEAGDLVQCTVRYDYKAINGGLLNSPLGLGLGGIFKDFTITETARAELGQDW